MSHQTRFLTNEEVLRLSCSVREEQLAFTGERVVPGAVNTQLWNEHISRYRFASLFAADMNVLDVGCGTGYGTELMARAARSAVGFDQSPEAIRYARSRFQLAGYLCASAVKFPFAEHSFGLVTAFEVIEHLSDWNAMLLESMRVLASDGIFLVSTPNTVYYSEARGTSGPNPFHCHEFTLEGFRSALQEVYPCVKILGQNQQETITFSGDWDNGEASAFIPPTGDLADAHFFVAVCSLKPVSIPFFADISSTRNLLRERETHLWAALAELEELRMQTAALTELQRVTQEDLKTTSQTLEGVVQSNTQLQNLLEVDVRAFDTLLAEHQAVRNSRWIRLGKILGLGPWTRKNLPPPGGSHKDKTDLTAAPKHHL